MEPLKSGSFFGNLAKKTSAESIVLDTYKKLLPEIFGSMSAAIGMQVILIVLEHAKWKTGIKYHDADKIIFSEDGICIDQLYSLDRGCAELIVREFILSINDTLSRLVGIQVAEKLTEKLLIESINGGDKLEQDLNRN